MPYALLRSVVARGLVAGGVFAGGVVTPAAAATPGLRYTGTWRVWPGVVFRTFQTRGPGGPVLGDLLDVDLRDPRVAVGLLHPPVVAAREPVSVMARAQHAVAGVNGDFFNIGERHPGVPATGSATGPEVADGRALKAAVPDGQRFGPRPPAGSTTEDVIGVDAGRTGRMSSLRLTGTVRVRGPLAPVNDPAGALTVPSAALPPALPSPAAPRGTGIQDGELRIELGGLNQYALPVDGVGAFTSLWGPVSRVRSICGSDVRRGDPCADDTAEVTVRRGVVTRVGDAVGQGPISPDTTVLVGREAGAATLRRLRPGDRVRLSYRLTGPAHLRFAVGGFAVLRGGAAPPGLDNTVHAARTAAGLSRNGRHLYLVVADSHSARSTGLTLAGLSVLLRRAGAHDAMNLDGGGSSTFVLRTPGEPAASIRNAPSARAERAVANGIGIFVRT